MIHSVLQTGLIPAAAPRTAEPQTLPGGSFAEALSAAQAASFDDQFAAAARAKFDKAKAGVLSALNTGGLSGLKTMFGQTLTAALSSAFGGAAPADLEPEDFGESSRDVVPKLSAALNAVTNWESAFKAGGGMLTSQQAGALEKLRDALRVTAYAVKDNLDFLES
ncbi:MAG: hypothetical protein LBU36_02095 [Clostridiales bacterium]|jgi:hypothetical protein|nr:hypothetical protein [Clostridiales bacterium]